MDYMDEMEEILDEEGRRLDGNVKFKLRQRLEDSVMDVVLTQHPNLPKDIQAVFRRGRATMDNPDFERITCISDPEELVAIARLALLARERLLELQVANGKLEQAG